MKINLDKKYLCTYILDDSKILNDYVENACKELNYNNLKISINVSNYIEKFFFSLNICKSMITDSFHGTIFSLIFEKPFLTFINKKRGKSRFFSLNETFELKNRITFPRKFEKEDVAILLNAPKINETKFEILKKESVMFLEKNLGIIK